MAIALGDNIKLSLGLPNDARYFSTTTNKPWTGVTEVNSALAGGAGGVRYTGLTVNIGGVEYWYKDGIGDGDLVEKTSGGGSGLLNWSGTTTNAIGTYMSVSGICAQPNLTFDGSVLSVTGSLTATSTITSQASVIADTYFRTTTANAVLAPNSVGNVILRVSGYTNSNAQSSFTPTLATIGTNMTVVGKTTTTTLQVTTGAATGCVLTSDASGNATWTTPAASTNNYATGVSGSGNGTITITRSGLSNITGDLSHAHGNINSGGCVGTSSNVALVTTTSGCVTTTSRSGVDTRTSFPPASHSHGNINNGGCIGSTANLVITTTTSGCLRAIAAGSSGQFLAYNGTWATPSGTLTLGTTSSTAYRGDCGNAAYAHISSTGTQHSYINQSVVTTASPTFAGLTVGGTGGTNTTINVISDDTGASNLNLYGASQGTGRLFVGQSLTYGGGIEYNGDNNPTTAGAGADFITLWRRNSSVDEWTARNSVANNDWEFRGLVKSPTICGTSNVCGNVFCATNSIHVDGDIGLGNVSTRTICIDGRLTGGNGGAMTIHAGDAYLGGSTPTIYTGGAINIRGGAGGHTDIDFGGDAGTGGSARMCGGVGGSNSGYSGYSGDGGDAVVRGGDGGYSDDGDGGDGGVATICGGTGAYGYYFGGDGGDVCICAGGKGYGYFCGDGSLGDAYSYGRNNYVCGTLTARMQVSSNLAVYATSTSVYLRYANANKLLTLSDGICVYGCGFATDWIASSDCRLKDNIVPISSALSKVNALCGVCYNLCEDNTPDMGLIAQQVQCVEPRLVSKSEPSDEEKEKYGITDEKYGLKYDKFAGLFVEAIKELKQQNQCLQTQIESLRKEIRK